MTLTLCLLLAAAGPQFEITDAKGKKPSGVSIEAGTPDDDGWMDLKVTGKPKTDPIIVWPYDARVKAPEGPGAIPVIVIQKTDKVTPKIALAQTVAQLLTTGHATSVASPDLGQDYFAKGVALLAAGNPTEAVDPLARALRERERVMTRIPSEIYPVAMLYGRALAEAGKYDEAATAFLKAINQRPSDKPARQARAEALIKAGKPEAAAELQ